MHMYKILKDNVGQVAIYRSTVLACTYVASILLANFLTPEQFGELRTLLSITLLLIPLTLAESGQFLIRDYKEHCNQLLSAIIKLRFIVSLLLTFTIWLLLPLFENYISVDVINFQLILLFLPLYGYAHIAEYQLQAENNFRTLNQFAAVRQLFYVALILLMGLIEVLDVTMVLVFYLITYICVHLVAFKLPIIAKPTFTSVFDAKATPYFKKSVTLSSSTFIFSLPDNLDKILAAHFLGLQSVAVLSIGAMFGVGMVNFGKPLVLTLSTHLRDNRPTPIQYFMVFILGTLVGGVGFAISYFSILYLFDPSYADAIYISAFYCFSLGLYLTATIKQKSLLFNKAYSTQFINKHNIFIAITTCSYIAFVLVAPLPNKLLLLGASFLIKQVASLSYCALFTPKH